jgi:uroporphyrinogen decarboxylase
MLSPKENYLETIRFGDPDYVPRTEEDVVYRIALEGNLRRDNWTDLWGVEWKTEMEGVVPFPKGNPIPNLDYIDDFEIPSPSDLEFTEELKHEVERLDRDKHLLDGYFAYFVYERAWALMGMDNFLMAFITHPEELHYLLHEIAKYSKGIIDRYLEIGVDYISFSEDLGSQRALMISPEMFREFFLPEYNFIFETATAEGIILDFHSCGRVDEIATDLAGTGATILNPVQARANDLKKIKSDTFGKIALKGAIDTDLLLRGTPGEVRAEVVRVLEILKEGGGYICCPDQTIPGFPAENMEALWSTAREVGAYR